VPSLRSSSFEQNACWAEDVKTNLLHAYNKIFIQPNSPEPKVKVLIPMYEPLKAETCKRCGKVIAEPKELIRTCMLFRARILTRDFPLRWDIPFMRMFNDPL